MRKNRKNSQAGFSLIELLIVVSIMLIIAAIAVPAVIASNQSGNEVAAAHNLQQLVIAENGYHQLAGVWSTHAAYLGMGAAGSTCPNQPDTGNNPPQFSCLLPTEVATNFDAGTMSNYTYTYNTTDPSGWSATATPASGSAGRKAFWVDATGVIRYLPGTGAITSSTEAGVKPIGQ